MVAKISSNFLSEIYVLSLLSGYCMILFDVYLVFITQVVVLAIRLTVGSLAPYTWLGLYMQLLRFNRHI